MPAARKKWPPDKLGTRCGWKDEAEKYILTRRHTYLEYWPRLVNAPNISQSYICVLRAKHANLNFPALLIDPHYVCFSPLGFRAAIFSLLFVYDHARWAKRRRDYWEVTTSPNCQKYPLLNGLSPNLNFLRIFRLDRITWPVPILSSPGIK